MVRDVEDRLPKRSTHRIDDLHPKPDAERKSDRDEHCEKRPYKFRKRSEPGDFNHWESPRSSREPESEFNLPMISIEQEGPNVLPPASPQSPMSIVACWTAQFDANAMGNGASSR
jgi:hypothetical protein